MADDQSGSSRLPRLTQSRSGTAKKITNRIRLGEEIRGREIQSEEALRSAKREKDKWHRYNITLLLQRFDTSSEAEWYSSYSSKNWSAPLDTFPTIAALALGSEVRKFRDEINDNISALESIVERLPELSLIDESQVSDKSYGNKVFIVHGHDTPVRQAVADLVSRLSLSPIVLQESNKYGRTIIENFEVHAKDAGFAVILLTPDDTGFAGQDMNQAQRRARQNVILECGFFIGALGRSRVSVLRKGEVEIPSDLHGLLYIELDENSDWESQLENEIRIGLNLD